MLNREASLMNRFVVRHFERAQVEQMADATHSDYSEQMLVCIQNCQDCHRACLQTLTYCLGQGGRHAAAERVRLLMDCAEVCAVSAAFMLRASELHAHTCAACAAVCSACAEECAATGDDSRMKALADTCRHCAESCDAMAGGGAATVASGRHRGASRTAAVMSRKKTD